VEALSNDQIATALEYVAELLEEQGANQYRVDAYRRGAYNLRRLREPAASLFEQGGFEALTAIPGVGSGLGRSIQELLQTGRLRMLERLKGEVDPESLLRSVPGIGKGLAERLHHDLGIETLEELEGAAHDGRLERVEGFGRKRIEGVRAALAARLGRGRWIAPAGEAPPVDDLLDVDREYREKAAAGRLRTITPARFNPARRAWLPVLHTHRNGREYTALFSNTERAHRLGKTHDWVVIYYDGDRGDGRATVITGTRGSQAGRRLVRGRELESDAAGVSAAR
jgi:putative hydrolase